MSTSSGAALRWRPEDEAWDPTPFLQGDRTGHGRRLIFDIEGNDLLPGLTIFWCIAAVDIDTGEEFYWGVDLESATFRKNWEDSDSIIDAITFLEQASLLLAHNGIGYDYPAIEKLYPNWAARRRAGTLRSSRRWSGRMTP